MLDWGMVGRLTDTERFELISLVEAVIERDGERLTDSVIDLTIGPEGIDHKAMERDFLDILDSHFSVSLAQLKLGGLLLDIVSVLREYRRRLPADLFITIKALVSAEGTCLQIYPDLHVVKEAEPYVREVSMQRMRPGNLWKRFRKTLSNLLQANGRLPQMMSDVLDKMNQGRLRIQFEHENLDGLQLTLERTFSRLTIGVIVAALIIGSSMIITTGVEPLLFGYPALGVIGYVISGIIGLGIIYSILRNS